MISLCTEVDWQSLNKDGEELCGDSVEVVNGLASLIIFALLFTDFLVGKGRPKTDNQLRLQPFHDVFPRLVVFVEAVRVVDNHDWAGGL